MPTWDLEISYTNSLFIKLHCYIPNKTHLFFQKFKLQIIYLLLTVCYIEYSLKDLQFRTNLLTKLS